MQKSYYWFYSKGPSCLATNVFDLFVGSSPCVSPYKDVMTANEFECTGNGGVLHGCAEEASEASK